MTGLVGGQYLDLRDHARTSADALREVHLLKTGRLMASSIRCAVIAAAPNEPVERALDAFGREIGLLFQIVDDILDVAGDADMLGKPTGSDERMGKATYVSMFGLETARRLATECHGRAVEKQRGDGSGTLQLFVTGKAGFALDRQLAGIVRIEMARRLNYLKPNDYTFAFVLDFPAFEIDPETGR